MSIDKFFAAIKNGEWQNIDELSDKLGIPTTKLEKLSKLLSESGLLTYKEENHKIKIQPLWRLLLPEEQPSNPKTIMETFVIPPQASIDVQSTHINNISNIELAVGVRIEKKNTEITIAV